METGIGRTGFRLLAFAFWLIGLGGIGLAGYAMRVAQPTFAFAGLAVALLGLGVLLILAISVPRASPPPAAAPVAPVEEPEPEPVVAPSPEPVVVTVDERGEESHFEYEDYEPAAMAAPEEVVVPESFLDETPRAPVEFVDTSGQWPARRGPKSPPVPAHAPAHTGADPRFAERYTQKTPLVRDIMSTVAAGAPRVVAQEAPADWQPGSIGADQAVGQCGQCSVKLIAPKQRPVHLTCPACGIEKLLQ